MLRVTQVPASHIRPRRVIFRAAAGWLSQEHLSWMSNCTSQVSWEEGHISNSEESLPGMLRADGIETFLINEQFYLPGLMGSRNKLYCWMHSPCILGKRKLMSSSASLPAKHQTWSLPSPLWFWSFSRISYWVLAYAFLATILWASILECQPLFERSSGWKSIR